MPLLEKMSPALSTRMNTLNFILIERGGVLARQVAAGVGLTRSDVRLWSASNDQELQEFEKIPDICVINFPIDDNTILTN